MSNKKYGLILPDKANLGPLTFQASRNVFGNDSDSEEESSKKSVLLRPSDIVNRQAKLSQEKAILEDPTVYQYDEIYDSMVSKKEDNKGKTKKDRKPQYIENLLKAAGKRKIENERRIERQIQKEREKEGNEFADKEVFVTSAYKKKLEEMKAEEEKERREEYLESIGDVTKQSDLGGFYRHLYEQKLGADTLNEGKELEQPIAEIIDTHKNETKMKQISFKRNYRKRKTSSDFNVPLSEGEIEDSDVEINRMNLKDIVDSKKTRENIDADSDFSIDESSDDEDTDKKQNDKTGLNKNHTSTMSKANDPNSGHKSDSNVEIKSNFDIKSTDNRNLTQSSPKIDIWKKRTTGEVFEQALKRYYERKAARGC